jgi:radical SAM protein with 4Fe4S-binding SPASM domain
MEKYKEARKAAERRGIPLKLPAPFALTPEEEKQPIMSREEAKEMVMGKGGEAGACQDGRQPAEPPAESPPDKKGHIPSPEAIRAYNARILPGRPVGCPYAWHEIWIYHQGEVSCCDTSNFPHIMGSVPADKITELWNGVKYRRLRQQLESGEVYTSCRHCHVVGQIDIPEDPRSFVKGI